MFKIILFSSVFLIIFGISFGNEAFALTPLERTTVSDIKLVNNFGSAVSGTLNVNQQVQISASILNQQTVSQQFFYIVQVKNGQGVPIYLRWIGGTLNPDQTFSPAVSWTPNIPDTYSAEIYVWNNLQDAEALFPKSSFSIIVA